MVAPSVSDRSLGPVGHNLPGFQATAVTTACRLRGCGGPSAHGTGQFLARNSRYLCHQCRDRSNRRNRPHGLPGHGGNHRCAVGGVGCLAEFCSPPTTVGECQWRLFATPVLGGHRDQLSPPPLKAALRRPHEYGTSRALGNVHPSSTRGLPWAPFDIAGSRRRRPRREVSSITRYARPRPTSASTSRPETVTMGR